MADALRLKANAMIGIDHNLSGLTDGLLEQAVILDPVVKIYVAEIGSTDRIIRWPSERVAEELDWRLDMVRQNPGRLNMQ